MQLTSSLLCVCIGASAGAQEDPIRILATGGQAVRSVAWSPDGESFAAAAHKRVTSWATASQDSLMNATGNTDIVNAVAYDGDGDLLVSSGGRTIYGWDASSGEQVKAFVGHTDYTYAMSFSGDGRLASAGDRKVRIWDMTTEKELLSTSNCPSFCLFPPGMYAVDFNVDATLFASGAADGSVMIRNASDGSLQHKFYDHSDMVVALAFSPDGEALATASFDGTVRIVDVASGETSQVLNIGGVLWTVVYSPDGKRLAAAGADSTVHIWDTKTWTVTSSLAARSEIRSVAFSPDGGRLLAAAGSFVLLWKGDNGIVV